MAYIYASWKFFDDRIHDEEITLIYFFGDDYLDYQKKVPATGVPYVKGYEFEPAFMERSPENWLRKIVMTDKWWPVPDSVDRA